ncbi:1,4-alpha-D-glucan 1-alpha-D-glucosylmutase [Neoasaia chiangmaiensis NBRC 101099]|uniref:Uncharacterized protein n=1 Tax=Neoasaia chiangmaiensis TaxID=320497 RepID=A0A1U9KRE4_9PROT|nr:malto-oligosyltrehalose synthase [Neoasaia chiangmaiensis]AQS88431.1 hypothetical protein A0U93_11320 [Neoasaia chiangmaiensis]GBR39256.1 1,4-alpha-D-glucan 1-alpha-D-glucosylmutase [Neoasaia chiangmaiensis NBRC 101099]GEN14496.1 malto-oligosyltrehalose synthase [Neoasaia chiangmaiensis]
MTDLRATVRLQFHRDFTLDDAVPLIPYFAALGISHVYASPLLASNPGSLHGYDTIDCQRIDPERGGEAGLEHLVAALRKHDMGLILDIVPNHMGIGPHNRWWEDVLAHGAASRYASFFDIDWQSTDPSLHGKILLPFLGAPLDDVLNDGAISLHYLPRSGGFMLHYGEHRFPISPDDTRRIFDTAGIDVPPYALHEWLESGAGAAALARVGAVFAPRTAIGRGHLADLLERQHYRLAFWRVAGDRINWRRFFDVTTLAALRVEDETVFEASHALIFDLYRDGLIDGVRADHVDGLARPAEYCRRLHERLTALHAEQADSSRPAPYIFVEKILAENERLPDCWPVTGTTGYEFLEQAALVLHDPAGELPLTAFWERFGPSTYDTVQRRARLEKLQSSFYGDFHTLAARIFNIADRHVPGKDFTLHAISEALETICLAFPVYRSYFADKAETNDLTPSENALSFAIADARRHLPVYRRDLLGWLQSLLHAERDQHVKDEAWRDVIERFEHLTAPLTAKAGEDTAFYRYNRLLSRNDVGTDPAYFAASTERFHEKNIARLQTHPLSLLSTATHDHKRGEDVRARLMVLSEPETDWLTTAEHWFAHNAGYRQRVAEGLAPTRADEVFIYQTLIGAWPHDPADLETLPERLSAYFEKAFREAAQHTSWSQPNEPYEAACQSFVTSLLEGDFRPILEAFVERIGPAATLNSLSQTLLRLTSPGVPDLYQGAELWDESLVDPDNRRPVDFPRRQALLGASKDFTALCAEWRSGAVKQRLIREVLNYRRDHDVLFREGRYTPVSATGGLADHLIAFRRDLGQTSVLVLAVRRPHVLNPDASLRVQHHDWRLTRLTIPGRWRSLLDNQLAVFSQDLTYFADRIPIDILVPA